MKDKKIEMINLKNAGILLAVIIALVILWFTTYRLVTGRIIDMSVENMKELSKHDAQTIETTVNNTLETLSGIGNEIRLEKPADAEALCNALAVRKSLLAVDRLMLFSSDGQAVNSNMKVYTDKTMEDVLSDTADHIVYRVENENIAAAGRVEVMIIGRRIRPFTVSGVTYEWLIASMDMDMLLDDVKLDSFDGEGTSVIVSRNGEYLLDDNANFNSQRANNIFDDLLLQATYKRGITVKDVTAALEGSTELSFEFTDNKGIKRVMLIVPMVNDEWNFCMCVPRAVFERQSQSLIFIFMVLMFIVMVIVVSVSLVISRKSEEAAAAEQRRSAEEKHRKELSEALVMAQSANRAKTAFLNNMSHDIRTPMNAIIGYTALATTHIDNREQAVNYLTKIAQSSNHLLSLINDVLDMSRIESGRMNLSEQPESLPEIILYLKNIIQPDINAKQLELFVDTSDISDEEIYCDKLKLNQVLLNILSNAVKYTQPGGKVSFRISERTSSLEGRATYEFRVRDNGIGMSPEFVKTVFDPFTREQTSTVSGIQGTGLGMSIAKNIVDMMGGTITVESEEHKGTEFVVTLEFRLQENRKDPLLKCCAEPENKSADNEDDFDFTGKRILLVEDNELNREIATVLLEEAGILVETAENGKRACEILQDSQPGYFDLVLMDVQMPVMDGYEATRTIRRFRQKELAGIPVIAMTANAFSEDRQKAMEAGMDGYISKPVDIKALFETIEKIFRQKNTGAEKS